MSDLKLQTPPDTDDSRAARTRRAWPWRHWRRWLPSGTDRDSIMRGLRTFAWVAPLTILVWCWAEREQVVPLSNVSIPIEISTDDPQLLVTILNPADKAISAALSGPRAGLDRVHEFRADRKRIKIFVPKQDLPLDRPIREVPVSDRIARDELFRRNAVTVEKVFPAYVLVQVDRLVARKLPVEATKADEDSLGAITISADPVHVVAPQSLWFKIEDEKKYTKNGRVVLWADLKGFRNAKPGRYENVDLPILFPLPEQAVEMPARITATLEIKPRNQRTFQIDSMPVWRLASGPIYDRYNVQHAVAVKNVVVSGPAAQVDLLDPRKRTEDGFLPYAILRLTPEDVATPGSDRVKKLGPDDFHLPKDVTVQGEYEVTYSVSERSRGGG